MIDLDEYRERSLSIWDRMAANWDRNRDFLTRVTRPVAEGIVARLDPRPGQTILDLAAGTGDTGFAAAAELGDEGKLISTDFAPGMVESARKGAEALGLENVEHRVLDAEQMDLEDDSIDGVLCRFGYMLMADPAKALAETRRVLRDGGNLSFGVWATPDKNLWAAIPGMTMVELGHLPPPEPEAPGIFALGDPERIKSLVTGAGFAEPEIEEVTVDWGYERPDEAWEKTLELAGPITEAFGSLSPEDQEAVQEKVLSRVGEALESEGGVDGHALVVHAR